MTTNPAKVIDERIQRDSLFRVNHGDLATSLGHLSDRTGRGWIVVVSESAAVQAAFKKVISAVAEAERQMDIRETELAITDAQRSMRQSRTTLRAHEERLAKLREERSQ